MDVETFLKRYNLENKHEESKKDDEPDTSLRGQALERAKRLKRPNAGTPFDWEDWQRIQQEDDQDKSEAP